MLVFFLKRYICIPADNTCHKWDFHWRAVKEEKNTLLCTKFKLETEHLKLQTLCDHIYSYGRAKLCLSYDISHKQPNVPHNPTFHHQNWQTFCQWLKGPKWRV